MSSTDKTRLDDASGVNGIVKCNGSGDFSAAVAGTDYLTSASPITNKTTAKAWVNFNGTGTIGTNQTIRSSYNVSSVTKNGTGDYTVNFATPMADANYSVIVSNETNAGSSFGWCGPNSVATSNVNGCVLNFTGGAGAAADRNYCSVAIFGN